ncbi:uncharacterized protein METZ01_LOCUS21431 [marine metagenome]|uniref:Uncharacterized protein n=1 Tax=marine metagenome TaxID=408172 RepID=A0A381PR78_9ZZZZ
MHRLNYRHQDLRDECATSWNVYVKWGVDDPLLPFSSALISSLPSESITE